MRAARHGHVGRVVRQCHARGVEGATSWFVDEAWCSWSKSSICAERWAWAVVAAGFMDRAAGRERRGLLFSSTQRVD